MYKKMEKKERFRHKKLCFIEIYNLPIFYLYKIILLLHIKTIHMPQLDFFIYPHIIVQSIIGIFITFYILFNGPIIKLFKTLKTRKLLASTEVLFEEKNIIANFETERIKETQTAIDEYKKNINNVI